MRGVVRRNLHLKTNLVDPSHLQRCLLAAEREFFFFFLGKVGQLGISTKGQVQTQIKQHEERHFLSETTTHSLLHGIGIGDQDGCQARVFCSLTRPKSQPKSATF